jgi:membrane protease YdiL (CAAX protease family)
MTYFADLTDYTYFPAGHASHAGTKNVGWLSAGCTFEAAAPTEELLDRLWSYCTISVAQTRGVHQCEFCPDKDVHFAERKGEKILLGTSEIRVFEGEGCIYAAPTLIYHYVSDHGYRPPESFIQALMSEPAPPAAEYFDRLARVFLEWRKTLNAQPEPVPIYQPLTANQLATQFPSDNDERMRPARPTPEIRLRDIALLLVVGLIVGTVLGLIGILLARSFTDSRFVAEMVAGTTMLGSWLIGYGWLAKARGWDSLPERFSRTRPKVLLAAAASGIGLVVLPSVVANLLRWFGIDVVPLPLPDILPRNVSQLSFAIVLVVIIGPLTEELIFRGLLLDWLKLKINVWAAAVILSVLFALLHDNDFKLGAVGALAFGVRMALGLAASVFAIRYRSLRASFVLHATFNGVACVASVLSQG